MGRSHALQGPPWEALYLVGHHMDPKTLATASCASKSWFQCLSSDPLWRPLCSAAFPSLCRHHGPSIPYRRLYSAGRTAARRRLRKPPKPALSLSSLLFALSMESPRGGATTVVRPCGSLEADPTGIFRFDVDVGDDVAVWSADALDGVRVTWHVVVDGWKDVFCMMECGGKSGGVNGWFSEELPCPGCCSGAGASGLVGDLRLGLRSVGGGRGEVAVEKVSVGVLSIYSWRYVSVDAVLAYLQHFLPPQL